MSTTARTHALLAELSAVALINAKACAATGSASLSWWAEEVRTGRAPQPVIRQPRYTRWRAADVAAYWRERAERGIEAQAAEQVQSQARRGGAAKASRQRDTGVPAPAGAGSMDALQHVGAAAPGHAAHEWPEKGDARELGGGAGIKVQEMDNGFDCGNEAQPADALRFTR